MAFRLLPYTPVKQLARELRMEPHALLRRLGWRRQEKRLQLDVAQAFASDAWPSGRYRLGALSDVIVPSCVARSLLSESGREWFDASPDPPMPPRRRPSHTGVVAVLAHVDHGKTTLLDALLGSSVAKGEAGGITQCVRPSFLNLPWKHADVDSAPRTKAAIEAELETIAFIDTPGHQAFINMRAVASEGADLAIVLIALDAGIQPQTVEASRPFRNACLSHICIV